MNIRHIIRIASITFEENYRKKFLYILFFISAIVILVAFMFKPFDMGIQIPVVLDISLSGLSMFGIMMTFALFLGSIPGEIEKKTIYPIMSKPINRSDYLWGKYLGNMFMIFINIAVLTLMLFFMLYMFTETINMKLYASLFRAILLIFIECGILGAIVSLFSPWISYPVNLVLSMLMYITGSVSQNYIAYLASETTTRYTASLVLFLRYFLPNFSFLHIKNSVIHNYILDPSYVSGAAVYGIMYILIVMLISDILFTKKDL